MKSLGLSQTQKNKLLEMLHRYFKDHRKEAEVYMSEETILIPKKDFINDGYTTVHWYEFVMTHLADRVFFPSEERVPRGAIEDLKDFLYESYCFWLDQSEGASMPTTAPNHPIDVLYNSML